MQSLAFQQPFEEQTFAGSFTGSPAFAIDFVAENATSAIADKLRSLNLYADAIDPEPETLADFLNDLRINDPTSFYYAIDVPFNSLAQNDTARYENDIRQIHEQAGVAMQLNYGAAWQDADYPALFKKLFPAPDPPTAPPPSGSTATRGLPDWVIVGLLLLIILIIIDN